MYKCKDCGREFDKERGLQVHQARSKCNRKKQLKSKTQKQEIVENGSTAAVMVPASLGENKFMLRVELSIAATRIVPA